MFDFKQNSEALIQQFSQASSAQGEALRVAVGDATLKALQGRELTLKNIREVIKNITSAATKGAAANLAPKVDVEELLEKAFAGMDAALQQAVEANRRALAQLVDQGASLREVQLKKALTDLEKMEDTLFATIEKATRDATAPLQSAWTQVLQASKLAGTGTGGMANASVSELAAKAKSSMREGRELSLKAAQVMIESYTALATGVLLGMSQGMAGNTSQSNKSAAVSETPSAGSSASKSKGTARR